MESFQIILTSAVVAAVIGPIASFVAQRRLAERQARLDYESAARRRLYDAVGPLRFQLLMAARGLVRRMEDHHQRAWIMDPDLYYVTSFVYRVLRPLAIGDLIGRQTNYSDFTLDADALLLLKFQTASYRMLTSKDPIGDHPDLDWFTQSQHLFSDNLRAAAGRLIEQDESGRPFVMDYPRFVEAFPAPKDDEALAPLVALFGNCDENLTENPIFWTRLVGYGYVCSWLLDEVGTHLGFAARPLPVVEMLSETDDEYTVGAAQGAPERLRSVVREPI